MRFLFLSVLLCIVLNSYTQSVTLVNCIDEGKNDILKIKETLDENNYLLCVKMNDTTFTFSSDPYMLYKINGDGNTVWKKELPKSDLTYYIAYVPNFIGYFPFPVFDHPYKIYSKIHDELILHYNYTENLFDTIIVSKPNILTFSILNSSDGSYKKSMINIDTLNLTDIDYSVRMIRCMVNKINDSIYQMCAIYAKEKDFGGFGYNLATKTFFNFYTINTRTNNVIKASYNDWDDAFENVFSKNNAFYVSVANYNDTILYISKIALDGSVSNTIQLFRSGIYSLLNHTYIDNDQSTDLSFEYFNDSSLFRGSKLCNIDSALQNKDCIEYTVQVSDTSIRGTGLELRRVSASSYNNTIYGTNTLPYGETDFQKRGKHQYFNKIASTYSDSGNYNDVSIIKINLESGNIEAEIHVNHATSLSSLFNNYSIDEIRNDISPANDVFISEDTIIRYDSIDVYNGISYNLLSISKYDSNLVFKWRATFPDSIVVDSSVYHTYVGSYSAQSSFFRLIPVNYNHQFIALISYKKYNDSSGYHYNTINKYFLVNSNTGELRDMNLPDYLCNNNRFLLFFSDANNVLSIIDNDSCGGNNQDIAIYKYNDIINSVRPIKSNADFDFTIYPNPANSTLQIHFTNEQKYKEALVQIVDISGKVLLRNRINITNPASIGTENLSNGMYFLQLQSGNENVTKKFQVIH